MEEELKPVKVSLSRALWEEIDELIDKGRYVSREEFMQRAVFELLHPEERFKR